MAQEIKKGEIKTPAPARYTDPFSAMRAEMDRVFDSFLGRGFGRFPVLSPAGGGEEVMPSIDVRETDKELIVEAELPGMDEKDVHVTLNEGILSIKGEKKAEREEKKQGFHLSERRFGSFQRSFNLPEDADPEAVEATFKDGVLTVTVPKADDAKAGRRKVEVKRG